MKIIKKNGIIYFQFGNDKNIYLDKNSDILKVLYIYCLIDFSLRYIVIALVILNYLNIFI